MKVKEQIQISEDLAICLGEETYDNKLNKEAACNVYIQEDSSVETRRLMR